MGGWGGGVVLNCTFPFDSLSSHCRLCDDYQFLIWTVSTPRMFDVALAPRYDDRVNSQLSALERTWKLSTLRPGSLNESIFLSFFLSFFLFLFFLFFFAGFVSADGIQRNQRILRRYQPYVSRNSGQIPSVQNAEEKWRLI